MLNKWAEPIHKYNSLSVTEVTICIYRNLYLWRHVAPLFLQVFLTENNRSKQVQNKDNKTKIIKQEQYDVDNKNGLDAMMPTFNKQTTKNMR